ncbi:MAG: BRO family protein [Sphingomonas sp.]|nr:BRO family protein [Sphingomonas sp.]MDX3883613.1 BRO family protein [Sphingomonas sp.]
MENSLVSYQFDENPVRAVDILGDPWFVASDVAGVLGYRDAANMCRNLDDDERGTHIMSTLGGQQSLNIISESGLYAAIFKSRRPDAQRFRKWVTSEVLPAIRKTGRFELEQPEPPESPPLIGDPLDVPTAISVIREARQVWGRHVVQKIWMQLGLPAPLALAEVADQGDPLVAELKGFIDGRMETTTAELCDAAGIPPNKRNHATSRRIGEAMRLMGWRVITASRGGVSTKLWVCPARLATLAQEGR